MGFGVMRVMMLVNASPVFILGRLSGGGFGLRVHTRYTAFFFGGLRDEETVRVVRDSGRFPREAPEGHAAEDDGERPNIRGLRVVFWLIIDFWCKVWIRANDA